jgi:uncharacterized membrane protein
VSWNFGGQRTIAEEELMTQEDIKQTEWSNAQNWSGSKLFGIYSSKTDKRLWVPKRIPSWGWTINAAILQAWRRSRESWWVPQAC